MGRRHRLTGDEVVGEIQERAQVVLIAGHAFLHGGLTVRRRWRLLQHEAAFAADRNDDGVLHHLRFHQTQHFGAKVLGAV
jgi:hypothetical protein